MPQTDGPMILFSIQDLFGYLRAHATLSGIQRVQVGIALHAIEELGETCGFLLNPSDDAAAPGDFLLVPQDLLRDLIVYASGVYVDHDALRSLIDKCEAATTPFRPRGHDTIILLGSFWGHGNMLDRYVAAKREGVRIGAYVYDIIPVSHPEYTTAVLTRDFSMSLAELSLFADFIFTISDYTRHMLARTFREAGIREIPMHTVPLAHSLTAAADPRSAWPASLRGIRGRPYVAYVSTVEGRKNHLYVVNVWKALIEEGVEVPDLVFVGRPGWRAGGLEDMLDGTHNLGGRVHIVHDLSDAELNGVYAHCLFTTFTSYVEGWGLPVGESLLHGVPCVASNASSIPEVGGHFVDYVDPLNLRDGIAVFRRMIEDTAYREARRAEIARDFVPRSWTDVGRDFIARIREAQALPSEPRYVVPGLPESTRFSLGELAVRPMKVAEYVRSPMRLSIAECFYKPESFGAWMIGKLGHFRFSTDLAEGTEIVVAIDCPSSPGMTSDMRMTVTIVDDAGAARGKPHEFVLAANAHNMLQVRGTVGADGICMVMFRLHGKLVRLNDDTRLFGVGLSGIGYARVDDPNARGELVERFTFADLTAA